MELLIHRKSHLKLALWNLAQWMQNFQFQPKLLFQFFSISYLIAFLALESLTNLSKWSGL